MRRGHPGPLKGRPRLGSEAAEGREVRGKAWPKPGRESRWTGEWVCGSVRILGLEGPPKTSFIDVVTLCRAFPLQTFQRRPDEIHVLWGSDVLFSWNRRSGRHGTGRHVVDDGVQDPMQC